MRQRRMSKKVVLMIASAVTLIIALPGVLMAQATPLDPETRAVIERVAKENGYRIAPGLVNSNATPFEPSVALSPTPQPEETPVVLPDLDLTDLAEYSNAGVTIQAPVDWIVENDLGEDTPFVVEIPGSEVIIGMQADSSIDFPSLLSVSLFRGQAELLLGSELDGAQLDESTTLYTQQGIPMAKVSFSGDIDGFDANWTFYVVAPNEMVYLLVAGGPPDEWALISEGVELIAESITFDEDLVGLVAAGDEPLAYADADGLLELELPAGWFVIDTDDPLFPVMAAEPEVRYVVAIGAQDAFGEELNPDLFELYNANVDELSQEEYDALVAQVMDALGESSNEMNLDPASSDIFNREGAMLIRMVGDVDLGNEAFMPALLYLDIRENNGAMFAVFGDVESALIEEDLIRTLIESVTILE